MFKLSEIPTTNLRILVSLSLAVIYVLALLVMLACGVNVPSDTAGGLGLVIVALLTADVVQFGVKRATYKPDAAPPAGPSAQRPLPLLRSPPTNTSRPCARSSPVRFRPC